MASPSLTFDTLPLDGYIDYLLFKGRSAASVSVSSTRFIDTETASNFQAQELAKVRELLLEPFDRAIKEQLAFAPPFPSNAGLSVKRVIKVEPGSIPCIDVPDDEPKIETEESAQEANGQEVNAQPANTGSSQMMNNNGDDDDGHYDAFLSMPPTSRPFNTRAIGSITGSTMTMSRRANR